MRRAARSSFLGLMARRRSLRTSCAAWLSNSTLYPLRYVLAAVLSRRARRRSGLRLLLSVDALQVCQQGDGSAVTPEAYEEWRRRQARPDEYPSERFIRCDSNDGGWAQMQDLAGRRVPWLHRVRQRNSIGGGFTNEQAAAAIRAWDKAGRGREPGVRCLSPMGAAGG